MIKLKNIILEIFNNDEIDIDRLHWNSMYRENIAEKLGYKFNFNESFWKYPQTLYHCTHTKNVPLIQKQGLTPQNQSRGINNRGVPNAIFTTQESEEVEGLKRSYGPVVISIHTNIMKKDGWTPEVSREPEVEEAEQLAFILRNIGKEDVELSSFIDSSVGISEYTVIVYDPIPQKYLTITQ